MANISKRKIYLVLIVLLILTLGFIFGSKPILGISPWVLISRLYKYQIVYRITPSYSDLQKKVNASLQPVEKTDEMIEKMKAEEILCYTHEDCDTGYEPNCNGPHYNNYYEGPRYTTEMACVPNYGRERVYFCRDNSCTTPLYNEIKDTL